MNSILTYKGKPVKYDTRGRAYVNKATGRGVQYLTKAAFARLRKTVGPKRSRKMALGPVEGMMYTAPPPMRSSSSSCGPGKKRKTIKTKKGEVSFCASK